MKKWMANQEDRDILAALYRYGPLSAQAVIAVAVPHLGHYGYKRLWWLRSKYGLVGTVSYLDKLGRRKRVKRAAIYYLTEPGMRFVQEMYGDKSISPYNMRPDSYELETRYRVSRFLTAFHSEEGKTIINTAREVRAKYSLPSNVSIAFLWGDIAVHFPRQMEKASKSYYRWLANSIKKLQIRGIRQHVLVAADTVHRQKLANALVNLPVVLTHIVLPSQAYFISQLKEDAHLISERIKALFKTVEVQRNIHFLIDKVPQYTVKTPSTSFFAADLSSFSVDQLRSVKNFAPDVAAKHGFAKFLFLLVHTVEDISIIGKLYPHQTEHFLFVNLTKTAEQSLWRVVKGQIIPVEYGRAG